MFIACIYNVLLSCYKDILSAYRVYINIYMFVDVFSQVGYVDLYIYSV